MKSRRPFANVSLSAVNPDQKRFDPVAERAIVVLAAELARLAKIKKRKLAAGAALEIRLFQFVGHVFQVGVFLNSVFFDNLLRNRMVPGVGRGLSVVLMKILVRMFVAKMQFHGGCVNHFRYMERCWLIALLTFHSVILMEKSKSSCNSC